MKRHLVCWLFLVSSAFVLSAQNPASHKALTPLEQTLIDNSRAFPEALKTKNVASLKQMLADDFFAVGSEGGLHQRSEILDWAAESGLKDYTVYNATVAELEDDTAIVTYNFIVSMPEGDTDLAPRYQRVSDLWIKSGEQWKLKFQQATPLRAID
ncbi:MAG: nuclear transport factor 2 family protein [Acidobacteriaceae bacterium]